MLLLAVDIFSDVLHERSKLVQHIIFLGGGHVLLAQQKTHDSTQILGSYPWIRCRRIVLLQQGLDVANQLGGKL